MAKDKKVYSRGDSVPEDGEYICVPCGFKKMFKKGETFEECLSCLSKGSGHPTEQYIEGLELWEKIS